VPGLLDDSELKQRWKEQMGDGRNRWETEETDGEIEETDGGGGGGSGTFRNGPEVVISYEEFAR